MFEKSRKAGFVKHSDPDVYIRKDSKKRQWLPHRVALLILSSRGDAVFLTLPKKAAENGDEHIRVPPQGPLSGSGLVTDSVWEIARDVLTLHTHRNDFSYIGSTYGNRYQGGVAKPYSKQIHWMALTVERKGKIFNKDSDSYNMGHWFTQNQLLSLEGVCMSDRKYMMTLQAILAYTQTSQADIKLAGVAQRRLHSV